MFNKYTPVFALIVFLLFSAFSQAQEEVEDGNLEDEIEVFSVYAGWKGEEEYNEALRYLYGIELPVDVSKGLKLLRKSADYDYPTALNLLGNVRFYGYFDLRLKKSKAVNWWKIGAELGDPYCAMNLAKAYLYKDNYEFDLDVAEKYLNQVRDASHDYEEECKYLQVNDALDHDKPLRSYLMMQSEALYLLGEIYQYRSSLEENEEKQFELEKKAFEYFTDAASEGNHDSLYELASAYAFGLGVDNNFDLANEYLERAIKKTKQTVQKQYFQSNSLMALDRFEQYEMQEEIEENAKDAVASVQYKFANRLMESDLGDKLPAKDAIKWYELAAESGREWAMIKLAFIYWDGEGVEKNAEKAFEWFKRLSDEFGHSTGSYNAGIMYRNGFGTEKDEESALKYLEKASSLSYVAHLALEQPEKAYAVLNYYEALEACKKGVKEKDPYAQYYMAKRYDHGWGVEKNIKKAHKLYQKSAKKGLKDAQYELGMNYRYSDFGSQYKKSKKWLMKAADQEHADACFRLAYLIQKKVLEDDTPYKTAYKYYKKCLEINPGFSAALNNIGFMYDNGIYFVEDDDEAVKYYSKAAALGDDYGLYNMGLYESDKKNYEKAFEWYLKASEKGHVDATKRLAILYEQGLGCEQSLSEAIFYYRKAAMEGDKESIRFICAAYIYGVGLQQNLDLALRWCYYAISKNVYMDISILVRVQLEKGMYEGALEILKDNKGYMGLNDGVVNYLYYSVYTDKKYVENNNSKARKYLKRSLKHGYPQAVLVQGNSYYAEKDYIKAYESFQSVIENESYVSNLYIKDAKSQAAYNLACMLMKGQGVHKNEEEGMGLIKESADLGYAQACFAFALSHFQKREFAPNRDEAIKYLLKAASKGHSQAMELLKEIEAEENEKKNENKEDKPAPSGGYEYRVVMDFLFLSKSYTYFVS